MDAERLERAARDLLAQVVMQGHANGPIDGLVTTSPDRLQWAADDLRAALDVAQEPAQERSAREEEAMGLIAAERRRQVESEGWTKAHDDEHDDQELARAAACYATPVYLRPVCKPPPEWPWDDEWWRPTQTDRVRELTKAGALIAAEIDRLLRARSRPACPITRPGGAP